MTNIHRTLSELGITLPEGEKHITGAWVIDQPFAPQLGQCYELAFGKLWRQGEYRPVIKRVRVDGSEPYEWFDLEENKMLDAQMQACQVKGFRVLNV